MSGGKARLASSLLKNGSLEELLGGPEVVARARTMFNCGRAVRHSARRLGVSVARVELAWQAFDNEAEKVFVCMEPTDEEDRASQESLALAPEVARAVKAITAQRLLRVQVDGKGTFGPRERQTYNFKPTGRKYFGGGGE